MANVSQKNKNGSGLARISPVRKPGWGILFALLAIISLIALIDYDPSNYHIFPPEGESPLIGQTGLIIGRYAFAFLGLSAWLLPCAQMARHGPFIEIRRPSKIQKSVKKRFAICEKEYFSELQGLQVGYREFPGVGTHTKS